MELYDKKFVYFEWDKELDGKKGFVAPNIALLKSRVINNPEAMVTLSSSDENDCPFNYYNDGEITCDYAFAYYDPYYEFRKAYLEGKQLQFKSNNGEWKDVAGEPIFTGDEYRVKSEPKYVPFNSVQELIDTWEKKSGIKLNHELFMPSIWIKRKDKNRAYLITDFLFEKDYDFDVGTSLENLKLTELFDQFTFLDGSIIGKIKEE